MENRVQLIAYVNRVGANTISELATLLNGPLEGLFGGVHLLPFYYPIDGADAGFDPIDHTTVDPRLGTWENVQKLSESHGVMADLIVNHVSCDSAEFQDFLEKGEQSEFAPLFLTMGSVFPGGASEEDLLNIYRPRPGFPYTFVTLKDGTRRIIWTTFTSRQIDIDVQHELGREYLRKILHTFADAGIKMIRLDAAGYAIKMPGTSCFMIPETYAFIDELTVEAQALGIEVLVEIHSYYRDQISIAKKVDFVYDFALPPLILDVFHQQTFQNLKKWLAISPRNSITVLDTHDGIGIIDVGPSNGKPGLLNPVEIDELVESIHDKSQGQSRQATGEAASNLDLYQVNCTFYDALGREDVHYLLARAIQFFAPGIPQVYYAGFLAGENDMALLDQSGVGRDINRHVYSREEVLQGLHKPVVEQLCRLIRFRNTHPAFNGDFFLNDSAAETIEIRWKNEGETAALNIDFSTKSFKIVYTFEGQEKVSSGNLSRLNPTTFLPEFAGEVFSS